MYFPPKKLFTINILLLHWPPKCPLTGGRSYSVNNLLEMLTMIRDPVTESPRAVIILVNSDLIIYQITVDNNIPTTTVISITCVVRIPLLRIKKAGNQQQTYSQNLQF